jgi:hypothetical protein
MEVLVRDVIYEFLGDDYIGFCANRVIRFRYICWLVENKEKLLCA